MSVSLLAGLYILLKIMWKNVVVLYQKNILTVLNVIYRNGSNQKQNEYDASFHHIFFSKPFDVLKISQNTHCSPTVCMI